MSLSSYKHVIDKNTSDIVALQTNLQNLDQQVQNNSGSTNSNLDLKEDKANKGIAGGYAPLNASSKIDKQYLDQAVMHYRGPYTLDMPLPSDLVSGDIFIVQTGGTPTLNPIAGVSSVKAKDLIIYNGSTFDLIDGEDDLQSFNGRTDPHIMPQTGDYTAQMITYNSNSDVKTEIDNLKSSTTTGNNALDARVTTLEADCERIVNKDQANGYAGLDGNAKLPKANIEALNTTDIDHVGTVLKNHLDTEANKVTQAQLDLSSHATRLTNTEALTSTNTSNINQNLVLINGHSTQINNNQTAISNLQTLQTNNTTNITSLQNDKQDKTVPARSYYLLGTDVDNQLQQADSQLKQNADNIVANNNALDARVTVNEGDISNLQTVKQERSERDQPNGYPTLNASSKISLSQVDAVHSFNGRNKVVVPQAGDYTDLQVNTALNGYYVVAGSVNGALINLDLQAKINEQAIQNNDTDISNLQNDKQDKTVTAKTNYLVSTDLDTQLQQADSQLKQNADTIANLTTDDVTEGTSNLYYTDVRVSNRINNNHRGQVNGVCELDANSKIPLNRLPTDAVIFKSAWNANTNTPTLNSTDPSNVNGDVYIVSTAGSQSLGLPFTIDFEVGDWAVFNSTLNQFQKVDNSKNLGDYTSSQISQVAKTNYVSLGTVDTAIGELDSQVKQNADDIVTANGNITNNTNAISTLNSTVSGLGDNDISATTQGSITGPKVKDAILQLDQKIDNLDATDIAHGSGNTVNNTLSSLSNDISTNTNSINNLPSTYEQLSNKGSNNGYCGLDANGLVDVSDLPFKTFVDSYTVTAGTGVQDFNATVQSGYEYHDVKIYYEDATVIEPISNNSSYVQNNQNEAVRIVVSLNKQSYTFRRVSGANGTKFQVRGMLVKV
jgi:hypothetical protein